MALYQVAHVSSLLPSSYSVTVYVFNQFICKGLCYIKPYVVLVSLCLVWLLERNVILCWSK